MAELDTSSGGSHKKGPGVKKSPKKSTKVDLTPMVDLGFLLITFFVFTTTMSQPTAMQLNEPKPDPHNELEVKESATMTFLLGKQDKIYYYSGRLTDPNSQFKSSNFKEIRQIIVDKKKSTVPADLMFIIKADKKATYKDAIDILDEMTISSIPPGHYAEVDLNDQEAKLIQQTEAANGIQ
jgi:biopolymer transport protein ExbD